MSTEPGGAWLPWLPIPPKNTAGTIIKHTDRLYFGGAAGGQVLAIHGESRPCMAK